MCSISGGNWNNTTNAGVWSLNLNNHRSNSNNNVGVRGADYDNFTINPQILIKNSGVIGIYCPVLVDNIKQNLQCTLLFGSESENQESNLHESCW